MDVVAGVGRSRDDRVWVGGRVRSGSGGTGALAIVGGACLGVAVAGLVIGVGVAWQTMWIVALPATVVWIAAATASLWSSAVDPNTRLFGYRLGVAAAAVALAASRVVRHGVTDQILDVGRRAGLGGALGDPRLRIGFEVRPGTFRTVDGSSVVPDRAQVMSEFDLGVEGRARVVHRPGLFDDRRIRADVEAAVRLLAEQHRLTRDVTEASVRVAASRRRLIDAEEAAAAAFAVELDRRVLPHLDDIVTTLRIGASTAVDPSRLAVSVRTELSELAAGIAPRGLREGLPTTLRSMAMEAPIAVELILTTSPSATTTRGRCTSSPRRR